MKIVGFRQAEWNNRPPEAETLKDGRVRVTRNLEQVTRADEMGGSYTVWTGEVAVMSEAAYFAYVAGQEVEHRREAEIIDDYTLALIEEGVL